MENSKNKRLIIVGASGHGKVVADIAKLNGYNDIVFLDDDLALKECAGYPVIGDLKKTSGLNGDLFVAVGNPMNRKRIMDENANRFFPILIHPKTVVADGTMIGDGTVIMAGAIINPCVQIGMGCIINTSCSVDHDCIISDYVHVAVGTHICGTVVIGKRCWIGAGSTVSNNIDISADVIIGAGATVVNDIKERGTYVGVPAKKKDKLI